MCGSRGGQGVRTLPGKLQNMSQCQIRQILKEVKGKI